MSVGLRKLGNVTVLAHETDDEFLLKAEPHRRELLAHCYRMTGSLHDAEDLVQETYLRAWKAYSGFKGQSSVRTWLYRIATNTCLTALDSRQRRPLPTGLGAPSSDAAGELTERNEVPWLEPLPDDAYRSVERSSGPGSRCAWRSWRRCSICRRGSGRCWCCATCCSGRPPRSATRSVRPTAAVNSLLQRARAQLEAVGPSEDDELAEPDSPETKDLLDRYIAAFEAYDIDELVKMFTDDAIWEMPPFDGWYQGPEQIVTLTRVHCPAEGPGDMRFIRTTANGQPAAALYMLNRETGKHEAFQLHVLDIKGDGVSHVVAFLDTALFDKFGLPAAL